MRIAVLGCGPAGLLAALAVEQAGHEVRIFSKKKPSVIEGAQFLHEAIPDLTEPEPNLEIDFTKIGTKEGYAKKVYGSPTAPCSWDEFPEQTVSAWSLDQAYNKLWRRYAAKIENHELHEIMLRVIVADHDLVISSVPTPVLCQDLVHHFFESQPIWIEIREGDDDELPQYIEYDGDPTHEHYRESHINGRLYREYGGTHPPVTRVNRSAPLIKTVPGRKPIKTTCKCRPEIMRVGRFGKWQKGVLVHDAYNEVRARLELEV